MRNASEAATLKSSLARAPLIMRNFARGSETLTNLQNTLLTHTYYCLAFKIFHLPQMSKFKFEGKIETFSRLGTLFQFW